MKSQRVRAEFRLTCVTLVMSIMTLAGCGGGDDELRGNELSREVGPQAGPEAPRRSLQSEYLYSPQGQSSLEREQPQSVGGYTVDLAQREAARLFYTAVFKASEGVGSAWTGSTTGCVAGETSAEYKDAVLRRINWFRAMAGVPASVQFDATFNRKAQQAALVMAANSSLSHTPPPTWTCNNTEATEAAGSSNLSLGRAGPDSVASGYMEDSGSNNTAVGHRRWILYPQTQTMGTGDVTGSRPANALWVFDNRFSASRPAVRDEFVAWPPPGYVPYKTVYPRWSFSYPKADWSTATVSMTENGAVLTTRKEAVSNGAGENTLVWLPGAYTDGMSWARPGADTVYTVQIAGVKINGVTRSFNYTVRVFDPDVSTQRLVLTGSATPTVGQSSTYGFSAFPGAAAYQWRSLQFSAATFNDSAEGDLSQLTAATTSGYSVQASGVAATGSRSFHLAHPQPVDQILTLQGDWVPTAQTNLRFASRLGLASPNQFARVEISQDGGANWAALFEQAGTQSGSTSSSGETAFTQKLVSLATYEGRTIKLRFRYGFESGTYYPQTSDTAGWFIDDVSLDGANRLTQTGEPVDIGTGTQFSFTPSQVGGVLLQVRPGLFGFFGEWSAVKAVTVQTGSGTPVTPPMSAGVSDAAVDCLFNWAQMQFPDVLRPVPTASQVVPPFRFRHYAQMDLYLSVSSQDQQLYLFQAGQLKPLGAASGWIAQAGCLGL